jgi:hypothetical protein
MTDLYFDTDEIEFTRYSPDGYKITEGGNVVYMTKEQAYRLLEEMQKKLKVDIRG